MIDFASLMATGQPVTIRMNFPSQEYQDFADLAARTGQDVDTATSNAVLLAINEAMVGADARAMAAASEALYPEVSEIAPITVKPWSGEWKFVAVTMDPSNVVYLSSRGAQPDRTGWTLRENVRDAVRRAHQWLDRSEPRIERGAATSRHSELG